MKCLSLTQPWASLVALGHKHLETRSWGTRYRGPLAIHAAKRYPQQAKYLAMCDATFTRAFKASGIATPEELPTGVVLCTCRVGDCIPTERFVREATISAEERAFGNFVVGRWVWILEFVRALPEPIPARGAMGLWNWEVPDGQ